MKTKLFFFVLSLLFINLKVQAQHITFVADSVIMPPKNGSLLNDQGKGYPSTGLQIGDKVPDVVLNDMMNYKTLKAKLSDFKGKLVILDFWGTGCTSCVAAFPELDHLQKLFDDKIQIILVNRESGDSTKRFFEKRKKIKIPGLPFVMGDTILNTLFPHILVPHQVWIDKNGIVNQITSGGSSSPKNVQAILEGKKIKLYEKMDLPFLNVWINDNSDYDSDPRLLFYTSLMKKIRGSHQGNIWIMDTSTGRKVGIHAEVASIADLFCIVLKKKPDWNGFLSDDYLYNNRVILNVQHPEKYILPDETIWEKWYEDNSYRYTLKVPPTASDQLFDIMKIELEKAFDLTCKMEKRKEECLALVRISKEDKIRSKGGTAFGKYTEDHTPDAYLDTIMTPEYILQNEPLKLLVNRLAYYNRNLSTPLIDDTHYSGTVDIKLQSKLNDLPTLRKELAKYGLGLVKKECEINMVVLTENGYKGPSYHSGIIIN